MGTITPMFDFPPRTREQIHRVENMMVNRWSGEIAARTYLNTRSRVTIWDKVAIAGAFAFAALVLGTYIIGF